METVPLAAARSGHVSSGGAVAVIVIGIVLILGAVFMGGFAAAGSRGDERWLGIKVWRDSATPTGKRIGVPVMWFIAAVVLVGGVVAIIAGATKA